MDSSSHVEKKFPYHYVQVCGGICYYAANWHPVEPIEPTKLTASVQNKLKKIQDGSCFPVVEIDEAEYGFFFTLPSGIHYPVFLPSPKAKTQDENQELKEEVAALKEEVAALQAQLASTTMALAEANRLPAFKKFSDASAQTSPSDVALAVQNALDEAKAVVTIQDAPAHAAAIQAAVVEVVTIQDAPAHAAAIQAAVVEIVAIQVAPAHAAAVQAAAAPAAAEQAVLDEFIPIQVASASAGAVKLAGNSFCLEQAAKELEELCKKNGVLKRKCEGLNKAYKEASQIAKRSTRNKFSTLDPKAVSELKTAEARASLAWRNAEDERLRAEATAKSLEDQIEFWTNMVDVKMPAEQMNHLFNLMFGQEPEALGSFRELQMMILEETIQVFIPLSVLAFGNRMEYLGLDVSTPSKPNSEVVLEVSVNADGINLSANGYSKRQEIADALEKASNLDGIQCCNGPWCSHFINCAMGGLQKPCNWFHTEGNYLTMKKAYSAAAKKEHKKIGTPVCNSVWAGEKCSFGLKCLFIHIKIPAE